MPTRKKTKADKSTIAAAAEMISSLQPRTQLDRAAFIKELVISYGKLSASDCGDCSDCTDCASLMTIDQLINPAP